MAWSLPICHYETGDHCKVICHNGEGSPSTQHFEEDRSAKEGAVIELPVTSRGGVNASEVEKRFAPLAGYLVGADNVFSGPVMK